MRRAVEKFHIREPHAKGGSREPDNMADGCRECHFMVDARVFRFSHFDARGCPRFTFHPGPLRDRSEQPSEVRERAPPRYAARAARRRAGVRIGSGSVPFG